MFEICVSGFLILSSAASFLFWRASVVAKWADSGFPGVDEIYLLEPHEEKVQATEPVWR
jgi:hypothetical protein